MLHSRFAPSSMNRTVNCRGSVFFTAGVTEPETEESKQGVAAHFVGQHLLTVRNVDPNTYINHIAPNGVVITDEIFDSALTYFNAVMMVAKHYPVEYLHIEQTIPITTLHPECFGTPDVWLYDPQKLLLYVWDYKHGHLAVSPLNNYQLISYDVGILDFVTGGNALHQHSNVTIINHIVSPRVYDGGGAVRIDAFNSVLLRNHVNVLKAAIAAADKPGAPLTAGKHCIGCVRRFDCPALLKTVASVVEYSHAQVPVDITPASLAYELQLLERCSTLLKYRKEAIEQEAIKRIQSGTPIPGYVLDQGLSNRKWKQTIDPAALSSVLGVDFMKQPEPRTPAQSELLLKSKGYDDSILDGLFERFPTHVRLKADDLKKADRIFSQHIKEEPKNV